jgi:two-component system LytT family sensor kinase
MNEEERYQAAKKRVAELKGFYTHLGVYLIFAAAAIAFWVVTGVTGWFFWPLLMWGIGLAIHAMTIFVTEGRLGRAWEERKLREYMGQDGNGANPAPPVR